MLTTPTNVVTVEPKVEPIGVEDVKANAYVVDSDEDNRFITTQLIPAARVYVEKLAGRSFITQTRKQYYDCLPCPPLFLRYGPVQSVASITYQDESEATQTLSTSLYDVDTTRVQARVEMGYEDTWPAAIRKTNSVVVTYTAGYGATPATVPILYRKAMIVLCTHWYENRDQFGCEGGDIAERVLDLIALEGRTLEYA